MEVFLYVWKLVTKTNVPNKLLSNITIMLADYFKIRYQKWPENATFEILRQMSFLCHKFVLGELS